MSDGYCNELCMLGGDRTFPFTFPECLHTPSKCCLGGQRYPDTGYTVGTGSDISISRLESHLQLTISRIFNILHVCMYKLKFEYSVQQLLKVSKFKPENRDIFSLWQMQKLWIAIQKNAYITDNTREIHIHASVSDSSCNESELMLF